ncbi:MAG: homoserine kinase [Gammaproteobacteria bacterium]|nr:homoserine kinase [Gammaproteobacteria bacterium]NNJ71563.1 homoserine kinase [Enterobacterales bacterium]
MTNSVKVFAPISIGNLSVGFDSLGMAVKTIDGPLLGDFVTIQAATTTSLEMTGCYVDRLPTAIEQNIVWHCLQNFHAQLAKIGQSTQQLHITLQKDIPVSSGLGSSACSVVAALLALNEFYNQPFNENELLAMMAEEEGKISGSIHYDNIAPCYLGGIQLMTPRHSKPCVSLPALDGVYWVMAYPDILVSTRAAREILPSEFSRQVTIEFAQNLASFVSAAIRHDTPMALAHLTDVLVEPYRQDLLPNYAKHKSALKELGCQAVGISGSGPTIFATATDIGVAKQAKAYLSEHYITNNNLTENNSANTGSFVHICCTDSDGARKISD